MTATASGARNRRRANLDPRQQYRMADTANSVAWQDPSVRPAFSNGVGRALVPGRAASGTGPRQHREFPDNANFASSAVQFPRASSSARRSPPSPPPPRADSPRFIFAGTVATESQRQSRGVLEHWRDVNERGVNVTAPVVSAAALKAFNQNLQRRQALKFPPQILGDVFADPNAAKDRSAAVRRAESRREAAALKGELIKGWSKVAEEDKAVKAAFGALKGIPSRTPRRGLVITDFFKPKPQPDGTITHFYKKATNSDSEPKSYVVVDETVEAIAPATPPFAPPARVMPDVKSRCDAPSRTPRRRAFRGAHQLFRTEPVRAEVRRGRVSRRRDDDRWRLW